MPMKKRKSIVARLAVAAFVLYIAVTLITKQAQISQQKATLAKLSEQLQQQQGTNAEMQRVLSENNDQYMASVARDKLGYAKPNERIYIDVAGK